MSSALGFIWWFTIGLAVPLLVPTSANGQVAPPSSPSSAGNAGLGAGSADQSIVDGNPAGLGLRTGSRLWIGLGQESVQSDWNSGDRDSPTISNLAGAAYSPSFGALWASEHFVVAVGAAQSAQRTRWPDGTKTLTAPWREQRIATRQELYRLGAATAVRFGDEFVVGASAVAQRLRVSEQRWLVADNLGTVLSLGGTSDWQPQLGVGMVYLPKASETQLGMSLRWQRQMSVVGDAALPTQTSRTAVSFPMQLQLTASVVQRWQRWPRWQFEIGGDMNATGSQLVAWGLSASVASLPSTVPSRLDGVHAYAGRAGVELSVSPGFLWLTAGYAYHGTVAYSLVAVAPAHEVSVGAQVRSGGVTVHFGGSQRWNEMQRTGLTRQGLQRQVAAVVEYEFDAL